MTFQSEEFAREFTHILGYVPFGAADAGECRTAAASIRDGDREGWHAAWRALAERVRRGATVGLAAGEAPHLCRARYLRAALYYQTSAALMERAPPAADPRTITARQAADACFASAMRLGSPPSVPVRVPLEKGAGPDVTAYLHLATDGQDGPPRPALIALGAPGMSALELYWACAAPATQAGWQCLAAGGTADGPDPPLTRPPLLAVLAEYPCVDAARLAFVHDDGDRPLSMRQQRARQAMGLDARRI